MPSCGSECKFKCQPAGCAVEINNNGGEKKSCFNCKTIIIDTGLSFRKCPYCVNPNDDMFLHYHRNCSHANVLRYLENN